MTKYVKKVGKSNTRGIASNILLRKILKIKKSKNIKKKNKIKIELLL
jgi:hypothetical protein